MTFAAPFGRPRVLPAAELAALFDVLHDDGWRVVGPTVADDTIVYDEINGPDELPAGIRSVVAPGSQRLEASGGDRQFDYGAAAQSWKRTAFPPRVPLWRAVRRDGETRFEEIREEPAPRLALLGVRACELAGMGILERALEGPPVADDDARRRRAGTFVIAVECGLAGGTCFCGSMGTGPDVRHGFDLALTELADGLLVRAGTEAGAAVAARLPLRDATAAEQVERSSLLEAVRVATSGIVTTDGLPERLLAAPEHPRWAEIAERCLACANCTMVCPTCFCSSVEQHSDLDLAETVAERRWDSCFTESFAAVAGGNFRSEPKDRYRQWLTHKFGTWPQQFGTFGCVGCGRCITWCPVGIDIRAELALIAGPLPLPRPSQAPVAAPVAMVDHGSAPLSDRPAIAADGSFVPASVVWTVPETADVTTLRLAVADPAIRAGEPGQFVMAALPGFPPSAISISRYHPDGIELTVRAAGPATAALGRLRPGDGLGLRGPLGRPWPMDVAEGRDVVVVAGGIGLAPLRPVIDAVRSDPGRFGRLHLCYGARTPADRLYVGETFRLRRCNCVDVEETVDRPDDDWLGQVGLVPCLLEDAAWLSEHVVAFVCGPERMMEAVSATLLAKGVPPERIYLTLERHMECGVGLCGHCQLGPWFVCRDGPVFALSDLEGTLAVRGI